MRWTHSGNGGRNVESAEKLPDSLIRIYDLTLTLTNRPGALAAVGKPSAVPV